METYEEFLEQIHTLNVEFEERLTDEKNNRYVITDGALNPTEYFKLLNQLETPRIMWLMKEPYDGDNGTEGGWDFHEAFFKENPSYYEKLVRGGSKPTWQPVVYITHSIMNGYPLFDDMDWIRDDPSMADSLNNIAWVNIQKLPAMEVTSSKWYRIREGYENAKDLLLKQIELLKPHFIICGGTFSVIQSDFNDASIKRFCSVEYFEKGGIVYINAYHPANRSMPREDYCNDIILLCKKVMEERNEQ